MIVTNEDLARIAGKEIRPPPGTVAEETTDLADVIMKIALSKDQTLINNEDLKVKIKVGLVRHQIKRTKVATVLRGS